MFRLNFGVIWHFMLSFFLSVRKSETLNLALKLTPILFVGCRYGSLSWSCY